MYTASTKFVLPEPFCPERTLKRGPGEISRLPEVPEVADSYARESHTSDLSSGQVETPSPGEIVLLPDYLPLQVGNKWTYLHKDSRYRSSDRIKVEIVSTTIIQWKSYYVFSALPFVPGLDQLGTLFVRYDEAARRYVRLTREGKVRCFPWIASLTQNLTVRWMNRRSSWRAASAT